MPLVAKALVYLAGNKWGPYVSSGNILECIKPINMPPPCPRPRSGGNSISASILSERGPRENNEDSGAVVVLDFGKVKAGILIVADGVGGLNAGEVASSHAVYYSLYYLLPRLGDLGRDPEGVFGEVYKNVNRIVADTGTGGATTLSIGVFFTDGRAYVANVGDSRIIIVGSNASYYISPSDEVPHQPHVIAQAVGHPTFLRPHIDTLQLHGTYLALGLTDGVTDVAPPEEIVTLLMRERKKLKKRDVVHYVKWLKDLALARKTTDNVTVAAMLLKDVKGANVRRYYTNYAKDVPTIRLPYTIELQIA